MRTVTRALLAVLLAFGCGGRQKDRPATVVTTPTLPPKLKTPPQPPDPLPPAPPATPEPPVQTLTFEDAAHRATQPPPRPLAEFDQPDVQRFTLGDGIEVLLIERHLTPTVTVELVMNGGSALEPRGKEGLAGVCMSMLSEGTVALGKLEFEEALADLASSVSSSASGEFQSVSMSSLSSALEPTLALWADTLLRPGFRQAELARMIKRRVESLKQLRGSVASMSGRLSGRVIHGAKHPFGTLSTDASLKAISIADCQAFWARTVKPKGATLYVVGDLDAAAVKAKVAPLLAGWKGKGLGRTKLGSSKPEKGLIFFHHVAGAPQAVISLMHLGPQRGAKDYLSTHLMTMVLGMGFSSRINMNIREKHGFGYGARGGFSYLSSLSVFSAGASVKAPVTGRAIEEIFGEIVRMKQGGPESVEVEREREGSILALPGMFETGSQIAGTVQGLRYFGLPLDYYETYIPKLTKVTLPEIVTAARKHLRPADLRVMVTGDASVVLPQLEALLAAGKLGKGKLVVLDFDGAVVAAPAATPAPTSPAATPAGAR